jgi:hypothetical protein
MGDTAETARSTLLGERFALGEIIDEDAFGARYAATDQKSGRAIEVKVFHPSVLGENGAAALWEACQHVAKVRDAGIQAVHGVGAAPRGASFIACQRVGGVSLHHVLPALRERGPVPLGGALALVHRAASILARAGDGVVHGTLRPHKIFLDEQGELVIGGFEGRAILAVAGARAFTEEDRARLSPEIRRGSPASPRCDVYGLGALLFELLSGRSIARGVAQLSEVHPEADREVDELVERALAPAEARFDTPAALARAIEPLLTSRGLSGDEKNLVGLLGIDALPLVAPGGRDTRDDSSPPRSSRATDAGEVEAASQREARARLKGLLLGTTFAAALVGAAVVFVMTRGESIDDEIEDHEIAELYEIGEIEIRGAAEVLAPPSARSSHGGGGGSHHTGSYEAAMMRVVDLGNARAGGAQGQLTPAQVSAVLDRRLGTIARKCLALEANQARGLGEIPLDLAIAGDGHVLGVSTRKGNAAFRSCVDKSVSGVTFPPFGDPRMGVRYSFSVD